MAQLGANPAIAVSLELVADRPRTAPRCCILGVAHHQLSGYVTGNLGADTGSYRTASSATTRISASNRRRDLKQSHSVRTKRRPIAIMRRSCSDSPVTASQMDWVFGSDSQRTGESWHQLTNSARPFGQGQILLQQALVSIPKGLGGMRRGPASRCRSASCRGSG
jgi:hypothetical protein